MNTLDQKALELHAAKQGKIALEIKTLIKNRDDLSLAYTPGVAAPCLEIYKDPSKVWQYTARGNWVAVITDGSAVLGLGNIGSLAGLPVMEGKAVLFKTFGNIDAFPITLSTQDTNQIIEAVKMIAPSFGGINLEDIAAPRCFEIEERLKQELDIPVFHDDQHGTAIVILAGLLNALKITNRTFEKTRFVINGVGAAGVAITKILFASGARQMILVDSKGIIHSKRTDLNLIKQELALKTNLEGLEGGLEQAMEGADVFIGVSAPGVLTKEMVKKMNKQAIVFALANPIPEIMPNEAKEAGALIVATGRSDFPNQINNVLAFPGVFRGALDAQAKQITEEMKLAAAKALALLVNNPDRDYIIPDIFDPTITSKVAQAVKNAVEANNRRI